MTTTPKIHLEAGDAAEIAEALTFLADWLRHDRRGWRLPGEFVGIADYDLDTPHGDLARLAFLLGDYGTRLFGEQQP